MIAPHFKFRLLDNPFAVAAPVDAFIAADATRGRFLALLIFRCRLSGMGQVYTTDFHETAPVEADHC